ncbi:hypothetical protein GW17_00061057 [Ensete ventricosum]|nr:hypothetical protein GW17_00061057 [Ensete ventricosum]
MAMIVLPVLWKQYRDGFTGFLVSEHFSGRQTILARVRYLPLVGGEGRPHTWAREEMEACRSERRPQRVRR